MYFSGHSRTENHRNCIGILSETRAMKWSERPPLPRDFLIFPLPFLIFSGASEHSTPVRFLAKLEKDFAPYRLFSATLRGTAGAKSFFFFAKRHTDFPFLQNFAPPGAIFGKSGFSVCLKKAFPIILFEIQPWHLRKEHHAQTNPKRPLHQTHAGQMQIRLLPV